MQDADAAFVAECFEKLLPKCNGEMFYAHLPLREAEVRLLYKPKSTAAAPGGFVSLFYLI
jgi:hypothetical protein